MLQIDACALRPTMVNQVFTLQRITSLPQTWPSKRLWHVSTLLVSLWEIPGGVRCSLTSHGAFVAVEIFRVRTQLCLSTWQVETVQVCCRALFHAMAIPQPDQQHPHTNTALSCCQLYSHSWGNPPELQRVPLNFPRDASGKYTLVISRGWDTRKTFEEEISDHLHVLGRNTS